MEWIKASERLPEENGEYIVTIKYPEMEDVSFVEGCFSVTVAYFNRESMIWERKGSTVELYYNAAYGNTDGWSSITNWMPLPEPPKEVDNG